MKNLFIIDGTSGIWKSDLINYISDYRLHSNIQIKFATRKQRSYEKKKSFKSDLELISEAEFDRMNLEYQYPYNGHKYGFSISELSKSINKNQNTFLIIRNQQLIEELNSKIKNVNIINVFIYTDFTRIGDRISIDISSKLEESITDAYKDYLRKPNLYQEVLINGSSENDFYRLVDMLIENYNESNPNIRDENQLTSLSSEVVTFSSKFGGNLASISLFGIASICLAIWWIFVKITAAYEWDLIEPKLSIMTLPVLGYAISIIYFIIKKKEIVFSPKKIFENFKEDYSKDNLKNFPSIKE